LFWPGIVGGVLQSVSPPVAIAHDNRRSLPGNGSGLRPWCAASNYRAFMKLEFAGRTLGAFSVCAEKSWQSASLVCTVCSRIGLASSIPAGKGHCHRYLQHGDFPFCHCRVVSVL